MMGKKKHHHKENVLQHLVEPIFPKLDFRDLLQVIVGASILAVPVGFTEETWSLGDTLPLFNVFCLLALSIFFIAMFSYHHYYKNTLHIHRTQFIKRVLATYLLSFIVVALIMTLIQRAPWYLDSLLAVKRVVIVTFPSSMSAAIADTLK